jgi:hypothetical protein
MSDKRQKNQLVLAFTEEGRSEAPKASQEGTESRTAKCATERPASHEQLMEEVCERENCWQAYKRVKANKGSPGIDGMKVGELSDYRTQSRVPAETLGASSGSQGAAVRGPACRVVWQGRAGDRSPYADADMSLYDFMGERYSRRCSGGRFARPPLQHLHTAC